jgi:hypothetical protein
MRGHTIIHVWCACGRESRIPMRPELEGLLRNQLLPRLKCAGCGQRQAVDLRLGWEVETEPHSKP